MLKTVPLHTCDAGKYETVLLDGPVGCWCAGAPRAVATRRGDYRTVLSATPGRETSVPSRTRVRSPSRVFRLSVLAFAKERLIFMYPNL